MHNIGVAVIGAGFIGPVHVEALKRLGVKVTGILGVDEAESKSAAEAMGLPRAYESIEEVLADEAVAAVHLPVPNVLHYEMAKKVLDAGKHVFCEKPLAMNSTESAELVYGVVLRDGRPDDDASAGLRSSMRTARLSRATPAISTITDDLVTGIDTARRESLPATLRYADLVEFDLANDDARCVRCSYRLGRASSDFKMGCLIETTSVTEVGPVRGEEYSTEVLLRRFYCPGCARQLEADVSVDGAPRSTFKLAVSTGHSPTAGKDRIALADKAVEA